MGMVQFSVRLSVDEKYTAPQKILEDGKEGEESKEALHSSLRRELHVVPFTVRGGLPGSSEPCTEDTECTARNGSLRPIGEDLLRKDI